MKHLRIILIVIAGVLTAFSIVVEVNKNQKPEPGPEPVDQPLVTHIYTADPSAHVFNGRLYIYPSHDTATGAPQDDKGSHFDMKDYHILSLDSVGGPVTDHGVALSVGDIPWASRQLWAPDAAFANGLYYLYFPAKDKQDSFRIGVATSTRPEGPFKAEPAPIAGSYSIDPCVFKDEDGSFYLYFGGLWGGQLQGNARVAKLNKDMKGFAEPVKEVQLVDKTGKPVAATDNDKRFFEGAWVFKKDGKYYFTYSTGDTHLICYATGNSPYGPFTYQGVVLNPVQGWTNHESIVQHNNKWYLFYHDALISGKTHLRHVKVTELKFNKDGTIQPVTAYK